MLAFLIRFLNDGVLCKKGGPNYSIINERFSCHTTPTFDMLASNHTDCFQFESSVCVWFRYNNETTTDTAPDKIMVINSGWSVDVLMGDQLSSVGRPNVPHCAK